MGRPGDADRRRISRRRPVAATVNLFYEVENKEAALRPGQRVGVTAPLQGEDQSLVVPLAALIRDIHGNTWVYENKSPHAFVRRRGSVDRVVGAQAALASGPKPGAKIVTDGAAERFGSEFHVGKSSGRRIAIQANDLMTI